MHLTLAEDLGHMLIQPLHLVPHAEPKLLCFLGHILPSLYSFVLYPFRRAHRQLLRRCTRHVYDVLLFQLDCSLAPVSAATGTPIFVLSTVHVPKGVMQANYALHSSRSGGGGCRRVC